jgi:hypothetical protein
VDRLASGSDDGLSEFSRLPARFHELLAEGYCAGPDLISAEWIGVYFGITLKAAQRADGLGAARWLQDPGCRFGSWGASMPDQRSRSRIWKKRLGVVGLVILFVVITLYSTARQSLGPPGHGTAPGALPDQVNLQSLIVNDRKHLFAGVLTYYPLRPMAVGSTLELSVTLTGTGQNPGQVVIPHGNVIGSRSLRVGGVEGATLSARGSGIQISPVGPTRGLIGQPGDSVYWYWDITPSEPGDYILQLVVVTYLGTSDNPLSVVNPPVPIALNVTDTWSHRLDSVKGWIIGFGAFFGALVIIFTFFREQVFGLLPKRKKKAKEQKEQSASTPQ